MTTNPKKYIDVYQIVTDRIISQLKKALCPGDNLGQMVEC
jgi:antirestriction protein ArdC